MTRANQRTTVVRWSEHPEMEEFLASLIQGHTEPKVRAEFESRFGIRLSKSQVANFKARRGLKGEVS